MGDGADVLLFSLPSDDDDGRGADDNVVDIFIKAYRASLAFIYLF
jgi:hypothetical protein